MRLPAVFNAQNTTLNEILFFMYVRKGDYVFDNFPEIEKNSIDRIISAIFHFSRGLIQIA